MQLIPLSAPDITEAEVDAVISVLRSNSLSLGPKLAEFEAAIASRHDVPHAIAVSSGTAALHLAVRALGIGKGDEVIIPSFTFVAVANAVRYEGATPIFVDINPTSLNIDPVCVESAVTPHTKAIIAVHTFGIPADMAALTEIANRNNLRIIEDACEAIGGTYHGAPLGSITDIGIFAFYPNKQITTGEGGTIITRDTKLAARMRAMRNQGRYPSGDWLQHSELGFNYRLSELACALGIVQLGRLNSILAQRAKVAKRYDSLLAGVEGIILPPLQLPDCEISWFVFVIQIDSTLPCGARDRVMRSLLSQGISCSRYFAPIHLQPAYESLAYSQNLKLPVTEQVAQSTLALPFFNRLSDSDATRVVIALTNALKLETNQPKIR